MSERLLTRVMMMVVVVVVVEVVAAAVAVMQEKDVAMTVMTMSPSTSTQKHHEKTHCGKEVRTAASRRDPMAASADLDSSTSACNSLIFSFRP